MRILYLMNCDWMWIAQRPHRLAWELDRRYSVRVLYPRYLHRPWAKQYRTPRTADCRAVRQLPFQERFPWIRKWQKRIYRFHLRSGAPYDIVWLSSPMLTAYLPKDYQGKVVYDCMDDVAALQGSAQAARYAELCQEECLKRADLVFVSSQYLKETMEWKGVRAVLLRNGCDAETAQPPQAAGRKERYRIGYIGTIAEWFDWTAVTESLRQIPSITYELWGPVCTHLPESARIHAGGVIEHEEIRAAAESTDCLIMPFVINDITLAVDPVKLYEYIGCGKCIVASEYPEIERFRDFVYFYRTPEELTALLRSLIREGFLPKYTERQQEDFLKGNTWACRGGEIDRAIRAMQTEGRASGDDIGMGSEGCDPCGESLQ